MVTCVDAVVGEAMVAAAGPEICVHSNVKVPLGRPSSVTVPVRVAVVFGTLMVEGDALTLTFGGWLIGGFTTAVTSALLMSCVSVAVKRRTYVPGTVKMPNVEGLVGLVNPTVAGPLTRLHCCVTGLPAGNPSSFTLPWNSSCRDVVGEGKLPVWGSPAPTVGGRFCGVASTMIVTSELALSRVSLAVSR